MLQLFNGKHYLQTQGTAMGTKIAVAFANIFMSAIETDMIRLSRNVPVNSKTAHPPPGQSLGI